MFYSVSYQPEHDQLDQSGLDLRRVNSARLFRPASCVSKLALTQPDYTIIWLDFESVLSLQFWNTELVWGDSLFRVFKALGQTAMSPMGLL